MENDRFGKITNLEIQLQDKLLEYSKLVSLPQSQSGSKQCVYVNNFHLECTIFIENRIYIRVEFRESFGMHFFSPFQPERGFKVYRSCKCSQILCSRVH